MARRDRDLFLSSTALDLDEHRAAIHARLVKTGLFHCIRQEDFGAQNAGAVEFCRSKVTSSDPHQRPVPPSTVSGSPPSRG